MDERACHEIDGILYTADYESIATGVVTDSERHMDGCRGQRNEYQSIRSNSCHPLSQSRS